MDRTNRSDSIVAIQRAAQTASQLTDQILVSTGQAVRLDGACDVAAAVSSMMPVLVAVVPDSVEVLLEDRPSAPAAIDEESLSKLVTNLVVNAGQAISGNGTVWLAAEVTNDAVTLSVRDDGCGMEPDTIARTSRPGRRCRLVQAVLASGTPRGCGR